MSSSISGFGVFIFVSFFFSLKMHIFKSCRTNEKNWSIRIMGSQCMRPYMF